MINRGDKTYMLLYLSYISIIISIFDTYLVSILHPFINEFFINNTWDKPALTELCNEVM